MKKVFLIHGFQGSSNREHLNVSSGVTKLPEVLEELSKMMK